MEKIAIYGGSFNPPTTAHAQVITSVIENTNIDKIIFTPDGERADKNHQIDFKDRKKIIEIFFEVLRQQGINIEMDTHFLEGRNGGDTTAIQVREYFRKKLGFYPWHIFGTDVIPAMPNWKGNKDKIIEQQLKKIFVPRPGYTHNPEQYAFDNFILLDIPDMLEISSSMAREMIANKQNIKGIIFGEIEEYIEKRGLYQS